MRGRYRLALSAGLALITTAGLLTALKFSERELLDPPPADLLVRQISVAMPPPPPPPPPVQQPTTASSSLELSVSGSGAASPLSLSKAQVQTEMTLQAPPVDALTQVDWNLDWSQNWNAFGLSELDQIPKLLTPIKIPFPSELKRRGIHRAAVKLHVLIDEAGKVTLRGIRQIDYPELKPGLMKAVRQARFTSPTKDGQAVRAEFVWPLELTNF